MYIADLALEITILCLHPAAMYIAVLALKRPPVNNDFCIHPAAMYISDLAIEWLPCK